MLNNRYRKLSGLILLIFAAFILNNCVADKKTVDPYPDRSYTKSAAKVRPNSSQSAKPAPRNSSVEKTAPKKSIWQPAEMSKEISSKSILPMMTMVNDRIIVYEGKAEQWNAFVSEASNIQLEEEQKDKIASCQSQLTYILDGYETLHMQLIRESSSDTTDASIIESFLETERLDINFLEGDCHKIVLAAEQQGAWIEGTRERLLEERERELNEKMLSGDYLQVIELYIQLPLAEGQHASYEATHNYGQALLRSGRENDAAEVFQSMLLNLREQNLIEREFKLMKLIADIQFGMENFDQAFERYIHIINRYAGLGENIDWARKQQTIISSRNSRGIEVRNYAELIKAYLTYNVERDAFKVFLLASSFLEDFPDSVVTPTVNHVLYESRDRAEAWFASVMQRVSTLRGAKKFQEALQLVENLPIHYMPLDKREQLGMLTDDLVSASFEEEESKRIAFEEAMQDIWSKAQNLLQAKDYDQAIEVFTSLLETTYADRAHDKIVEASQLAAQEDRREAAELFVRSNKAQDRNTKIALLLKSRQLLKGILTKYPKSGLVEKAQRNLDRIEAEIRSIDPALLNEPELTEESQKTFQHTPMTTVNGIPIGEWKEQVH